VQHSGIGHAPPPEKYQVERKARHELTKLKPRCLRESKNACVLAFQHHYRHSSSFFRSRCCSSALHSANIWTLQHTVASVIMATTAFRFIMYLFTVVSSLESPGCPFQTPVSTMLQHALSSVRQKWLERPKSWEGFVHVLRMSSRHVLCTAWDLIAKLTRPCLAHLPIPFILWQGCQPAINSEVSVSLEQLDLVREHTLSSDRWCLGLVLLNADLA
jgi:hypothetical protein